jgi:hypothetical protein
MGKQRKVNAFPTNINQLRNRSFRYTPYVQSKQNSKNDVTSSQPHIKGRVADENENDHTTVGLNTDTDFDMDMSGNDLSPPPSASLSHDFFTPPPVLSKCLPPPSFRSPARRRLLFDYPKLAFDRTTADPFQVYLLDLFGGIHTLLQRSTNVYILRDWDQNKKKLRTKHFVHVTRNPDDENEFMCECFSYRSEKSCIHCQVFENPSTMKYFESSKRFIKSDPIS